jgi:hypothetical protein
MMPFCDVAERDDESTVTSVPRITQRVDDEDVLRGQGDENLEIVVATLCNASSNG